MKKQRRKPAIAAPDDSQQPLPDLPEEAPAEEEQAELISEPEQVEPDVIPEDEVDEEVEAEQPRSAKKRHIKEEVEEDEEEEEKMPAPRQRSVSIVRSTNCIVQYVIHNQAPD